MCEKKEGDAASEHEMMIQILSSPMFGSLSDTDFLKDLGDRAPRDAAGADARPISTAEAGVESLA